jgi:hypothetical protein
VGTAHFSETPPWLVELLHGRRDHRVTVVMQRRRQWAGEGIAPMYTGYLPEGAFTRRSLTPDESRLAVEQAREQGTLIGLSDDDLLAPYKRRERDNHDALRQVLSQHHGITLSLDDFCHTGEDEGQTYPICNSLNVVQMQECDRLLVVTCWYVPTHNTPDEPFISNIDPTSVTFDLIEPLATE